MTTNKQLAYSALHGQNHSLEVKSLLKPVIAHCLAEGADVEVIRSLDAFMAGLMAVRNAIQGKSERGRPAVKPFNE